MYEPLNAQLPASWLSSRVGADSAEIERLRRGGELFATRPDGADEWLYSAWQFGPGGKVPESVRRVVRAGRAIDPLTPRIGALVDAAGGPGIDQHLAEVGAEHPARA